MQPMAMWPLACFLSMIRPPGVEFESSYLQILPIDKAKCPFVRPTNDIGFRLYTKHNPTVYHDLFVHDDEALKDSHINFDDHTVIFFHAFLENPNVGSAVMVREAYMLRGDTNVIMVDAQRLEAGPWYFTAAENTWYIGQYAAQFIDYLVSRGLDLSRTHLVGHSLGAQAAGVAGAALRSGRVSRITGLDPAMPLFEKLPYSQKLDPADAHFVDVIHTDAGIFGVNNPIGHADFYPNGGISPQPGCELEIVWPRQQVLEKCKTGTTKRPIRGLYFFELETKEQKKLHEKSTIKLNKYYRYTKEQRDRKKPVKENQEKIEDGDVKIQNGDNKLKQNGGDLIKDGGQIYQELITELPIQFSETRTHSKKDLSSKSDTEDMQISYQFKKPVYAKSRQKRFSLFRRQSEEAENNNFIFKMVEFLIKNRKNVIPVVSVIREMNTLVKSSNGELNHSSKERNSYIGTPPPVAAPLNFNLGLGKDPPVKAFMKRLLGLGTSVEKLSITGAGGLGIGK